MTLDLSPIPVLSSAERFKPSADVNLRERLAAVVARVGSAGCFLRPFENRKLRIAAMNHDPLHWIVALNPAYLASINRVDHTGPPQLIANNVQDFCSLVTIH
jgi:hypothetical protein